MMNKSGNLIGPSMENLCFMMMWKINFSNDFERFLKKFSLIDRMHPAKEKYYNTNKKIRR